MKIDERFVIAIVCTILFAFAGYYHADNKEKDEVIVKGWKIIQHLEIKDSLLRDTMHTDKQINLRLRQYISGSKERKLRKDSINLEDYGKEH